VVDSSTVVITALLPGLTGRDTVGLVNDGTTVDVCDLIQSSHDWDFVLLATDDVLLAIVLLIDVRVDVETACTEKDEDVWMAVGVDDKVAEVPIDDVVAEVNVVVVSEAGAVQLVLSRRASFDLKPCLEPQVDCWLD